MALKSDKMYSFKLYLAIQKINPEAAEYFWDRLEVEETFGIGLSSSFDWEDTPQGYRFWYNIAVSLDQATWGV